MTGNLRDAAWKIWLFFQSLGWNKRMSCYIYYIYRCYISSRVMVKQQWSLSSMLLHQLAVGRKRKTQTGKPRHLGRRARQQLHSCSPIILLLQITPTAGFKHVLIHRLGTSLCTLILLCFLPPRWGAGKGVCVRTGQADSRRSLQDYTRATLSLF